MLDACVVDQNVHAPKGVGREFHHGLNLRGLAHVGAVVSHLHTQSRHLGLGAFDITETIEDDVGALLGQSFGNAQTDTAGGTCDQRCFALQHEDDSER